VSLIRQKSAHRMQRKITETQSAESIETRNCWARFSGLPPAVGHQNSTREIDHRQIVATNVDAFAKRLIGNRSRSRIGRQIIRKRTNTNALIRDLGALVVALQCEGPVIEKPIFFAPGRVAGGVGST
jgi:hypothetical protein